MSRRILLTLEYDGTAYCGWQRQQNGPSVQAQVEQALHRLVGMPVGITGASRTDAGVHALGQRAHLDLDHTIPPDKLPFALNTMLPRDIRVLSGIRVSEDTHARFSALGKTYSYLFFNRRHPSALLKDRSAHVPLPLDLRAMRQAADTLVGTHDFAAFEASGGTAKTTTRTIESVVLAQNGPEILFTVRGNAFLYNMVRIIAGTLVLVGQGKLPRDSFLSAIAHKDRQLLGPTAPPQGLTLMEVYYGGSR